MSDSESEDHDQEYLMSTRERRSNAGNKMKRLLEQELEEMQMGQLKDDDDLDLLFQEDADDEEFEVEDINSDQEDFEKPSEDNENEHENSKVPAGTLDDMVLSESDDESTEQDDELEGERELQNEKALQRKRHKRPAAPVIKRKSAAPLKDKGDRSRTRFSHEVQTAETLLVSERRTSKRSYVVANKMEIYEKLSKAEKKRKLIQERIKKHKEQQKEEFLTQEDRIRIALETEKFNVLSLNKYKEQEISKKQTRLALQKRQKIKFQPGEVVLQEISTAWQVDPIMELEDKKYWDEQVKKREKKKKKYPRRQKKPSIETSDKSDRKNIEVKEPIKQESSIPISTASIEDTKVVSGNETHNAVVSQPPSSIDDEDIIKTLQDANNNGTTKNESTKDVVEPSSSQAPSHEARGQVENRKHLPPLNSSISDYKDNTLKNTAQTSDELPKERRSAKEENPVPKDCHSSKLLNSESNLIADSRDSTSQEDLNFVGQISKPSELKQVKFAEPPTIAVIPTEYSSEQITPLEPYQEYLDHKESNQAPDLMSDTGSEESSIFEGPPQLVAKNFITVYKYPAEPCSGDIRNELFGEQWSNSSRQRSPSVEPLCKITICEDSLSTVEKSIMPDLSFLTNFPSFGEYGKKIVHDTGAGDQKELEVEIKTQPPSGVLYSNGVRKRCLITNKECQYFDPKNGIPYSDVEAYKIIQEIQDSSVAASDDGSKPRFKWFGFRNGGIYLDVMQRPAKNVPEGF